MLIHQAPQIGGARIARPIQGQRFEAGKSHDQAVHPRRSGRSHPQPGAAVLGSYTRGGTVVTSGCTNWPHGLCGGDETVERITRNILDRLSG